jgi:hypothetical protein
MKQLFLLLACFCLPITLCAQRENEKPDSEYLAGAVPQVDGKVVFAQTWELPGASQEAIYTRMLGWMQERLAKNDNATSRVLYTNPEKGEIVGTGDEWIVFQSTALSLDRTRIVYQLTVFCTAGKCTLEIEKIRYIYRNGDEKYTADEWITDKYALNKAQTKLVRGLRKWRRKTVDFAHNLFDDAGKALGVNAVTTVTPQPQMPVTVSPATPAPVASQSLTEVQPDALSANLIKAGTGKLVVVIGTDAFNMTMLTANVGGSLGKMAGKPVVYTILSPDQPYQTLENADTYTVRFYPNGATEPSLVLECKKVPTTAAADGLPRTYVGEIVKAFIGKM